jgi:hypothetical protein
MSATITQSVNDTPRVVEDKVRDLPANQGKNDIALWLLVDTEVAQSRTDSKLVENVVYTAANKHGNK